MYLFKSRFWRVFFGACLAAAAFIMPVGAHAAWGIVDHLNLAPFVPLILDTMMMVASATYDYFVGHGGGIVYILVYGFVGISIGMYLVKMYIPKSWLGFLGFSGGGEMWDGKASGTSIVQNVARPLMRGLIAALVLLQVRPVFVTEWVVNPFLEFGAIYTNRISAAVAGGRGPQIECPADVLSHEWISASSCQFLVQPVADISHANNQVIKRGFDFIDRGIRGLATLIPHGGEDFLNIITGILLVFAFVGCNLFMALLIIQAIFNFVMALILYPFNVLTWVAKPKNPDKWFDIWPPFSGIVTALQKLVITMIACAFILCINVAVIHALFRWDSSVFVAGTNGMAAGNVPTLAPDLGFGTHSVLWLTAILTFYLMGQIFQRTRDQLKKYAPDMDKMYNAVTGDAKKMAGNIKKMGRGVTGALGLTKKK